VCSSNAHHSRDEPTPRYQTAHRCRAGINRRVCLHRPRLIGIRDKTSLFGGRFCRAYNSQLHLCWPETMEIGRWHIADFDIGNIGWSAVRCRGILHRSCIWKPKVCHDQISRRPPSTDTFSDHRKRRPSMHLLRTCAYGLATQAGLVARLGHFGARMIEHTCLCMAAWLKTPLFPEILEPLWLAAWLSSLGAGNDTILWSPSLDHLGRDLSAQWTGRRQVDHPVWVQRRWFLASTYL
jgi:hypothetical protein